MFIHSARRLPVYLSSRNNRLLHTTCRTMDVITLSDESAVKHFKSKNSKSILYFTASWCPPCKVIKPIYEEVSKEFPEIAFGKVDVDDNSDSATEFNIKSVPTFVTFNGETTLKRFSGANEAELRRQARELKDA